MAEIIDFEDGRVFVINRYSDELVSTLSNDMKFLSTLNHNSEIYSWLESKNKKISKLSELVQYNIFVSALIKAIESDKITNMFDLSPYARLLLKEALKSDT